MQLLNTKARIALKAARTGLNAYGATQRARGHPPGTPAPTKP